MFERYTERARRVMFFGRFEAAQLGSTEIGPEHLLLALIREDPKMICLMAGGDKTAPQRIREAMLQMLPVLEKINTSLDLSLTKESKQVLQMTADEAERVRHRHIGTEHLLLGILKQAGMAATVLNEHNITWKGVNDEIVRNVVRPNPG